MKSIKSILIPMALFVAFFAGVIGLQNDMIERWRNTPHRFRDTLYVPSTEYVRVASLGYRHFAADFFWLRMIQVFAAAWSSADNPTQINNYFNVITDLDPRFSDPYSFAIMGIGEEARTEAKMAESRKDKVDGFGTPFLGVSQIDGYVKAIIQKAITRNPGQYKPPYDGAFFAYWSLNDPALAKYYVRMAKQDPNYPDYIDRWEGYFEMKQGRFLAAFEKFLVDYVNTIRQKNKDLYGINRMQLTRTLNTWLIDAIKQRALEWKKTHDGKLPTVDELRQAGTFKDFEYPDVVMVNQLLDGLFQGQIDLNFGDADIQAFAKKSIRKWNDLPPGPYDFIDPKYRGYTIWPTMENDEDRFVLPTLEAMHWTKRFVNTANQEAAQMKVKDGKYPDFKAYLEQYITATDPFGKPWVYDQQQGALKSASVPDIATMTLPEMDK